MLRISIIDRYIAKTVLFSVAGVLLVISSLDVLFAFVDELDSVNDNYSAIAAFQYVFLQMPKSMYEFIPVSSLIGALIGLGFLASNSELVVLRAAGFSIIQILQVVIKAIIIVLLFGILLVQWLVPKTTPIAQSLKALHLGGGQNLYIKRGNWQKDGDHFLHFNLIQHDGSLVGLTGFKFNQSDELVEIFFAEKASFSSKSGWLLLNYQATQLLATETKTVSAESRPWETTLTPERLLKLVMKPDHLSVTGLAEYIGYLKSQGLSYKQFELAFWKKVLQPLVTIVMVILASSFAFGSLRNATMGYRVTVGISFGLIYQYLQDFLGYSSLVYQVDPFWAALIPLLIFAAIGVFNLNRIS